MIGGETEDENGAPESENRRSDEASNEHSGTASASLPGVDSEAVAAPDSGMVSDADTHDTDGLTAGENAPLSDAERMRLHRRRNRQMSDLAASLGLHDDAYIEALRLLDDLLPDGDRMSSSEDVVERLSIALGEFKKRSPRLLLSHPTRSPIDITDADARFRNDRVLEDTSSSEEELYRALLVNERVLHSYHQKALEHEDLRRFLLGEAVRRFTLVEQWRHLLPKYTLPIFSMMHAAGMKWKHLRVGGAVFNRIRDLLVDSAENGVSKADLMEAAKRTEDQFIQALKEGYPNRRSGEAKSGEDAKSSPDEQVPVPDYAASLDVEPSLDITACRRRIGMALVDAREQWSDLVSMDPDDVDQADIDDAKQLVDWFMGLEALGAGLTTDGRVVFETIHDFFDRVSKIENRNGHVCSEPDPASVVAAEQAGDEAEIPHVEPREKSRLGGFPDRAISADIGSDTPVDQPDSHAGDTGKAASDKRSGTLSSDAGSKKPSGPLDPSLERKIGDAAVIFSPAWLKEWPQEDLDLEVMLEHLPRGQGLSRSNSKVDNDAFGGFTRSIAPAPYCFMGLRKQVDLSQTPVKGPIDPRFWARFEVPTGRWQVSMVKGPSPIFGQPSIEMLPPHSDLAWYARELCWSEGLISLLTNFGNPSEPHSLSTRGAAHQLVHAFVNVAQMNLQRLVSAAPDHYLANSDATGDSDKKIKLAAKHLARWWIFVLLVRHDPEMFRGSFTGNFFLGVEGPDFVLDADGKPEFGTQTECSHFVIHDEKELEHAYAAVWDDPININSGVPGRTLDEI